LGKYSLIPRAHITSWRSVAPWQTDAQVEQDLVISRTLVAIYSDELIRKHLAFRGGTALYKLYLKPAVRYSEDIDLVQIEAGPIGPVFDHIKERLSFLGEPQRKQKNRNNVLLFRFDSEIPPVIMLRLKVEINCREHFALLGVRKKTFIVESPWFQGKANIPTFTLEELLGSKMRALYQRKQGRDLFDLWYALNHASVNTEKLIQTFRQFMQTMDVYVTRKQFENNLKDKMNDRQFLTDTHGLIHTVVDYDPHLAYEAVMNKLISKLA
jgi:predicted nucleotidyltransferase component of viral defense system